MHRLRYLLIGILLLVPLTLSAQDLPPANPGNFTGDIAIGTVNTTLEPTETIAIRFQIEGFVGAVNVNGVAVADGIQRFCSGELDIIIIDRQITSQEASACNATARSPLAFRVGTKSVSVAVSPQNKILTDVTTAELQQIFAGSPTWDMIRPDSSTEIIGRFGPGTTSAEVEYFAQAVFGGQASLMTTALGAQYNDDPFVALNAVAISEFAIGIFDSAFLNANREIVQVLSVDGVPPRFDTISSGTYPLSRPLLLYSAPSIMQEKPQVAEFIKYYLLNLDLEFPPVNLFPPGSDVQQINTNSWLSATGQAVSIPAPVATEEAVNIVTIDTTEPSSEELVIEPESREPVSPFSANVIPLLISARTDLEVMATQVLGIQRPPGWSGSLDINDPQLPLLTRLDTELLAAIVYGQNTRPAGWFGAVGSSQLAIVRDIRHDLEIMADTVYSGARPFDWAGADPIYRCSRSTQALAAVLQRAGLYEITVDPLSASYCQQIEIEVARYTEVNLVNESSPVIGGESGTVGIPREAEITGNFAIGFLSRFATPQVGVMPVGTQITPIARSYSTGSNMTLVEGTDFLVFIEYIYSDLTDAQWELLPDISEYEDVTPYCTAIWCS